jgi:mannose-1-phosphate guanylyltransferase
MQEEVSMSQSIQTFEDRGRHRWGVILAGGDGTRLRPLTQLACGDNRPKQFCPLLGGKTLLAQTRLRISGSIDQDRTLFVLTRKHEPFYSTELEMVPSAQKVVQPANQGTLPAILWTLLRLFRFDQNASVAFFPSDHYFADEKKFITTVESAFIRAEESRKSVILLGASSTRPGTGYGWIEPEFFAETEVGDQLAPVKRFWEKPTQAIAQELLAQGCFWNTFVMIGNVTAFLEMIHRVSPDIFQTFASTLSYAEIDMEEEAMKHLYDRLSSADFSKQVLSVSTEMLSVANCGDAGWSDLGDPRRLVNALSEAGVDSPWAKTGLCSMCGQKPDSITTLPPGDGSSELAWEGGAVH